MFENYAEFFNHLLDLEEIQHWRDIKHYTIRSCTVLKDRRTDHRGYNRFRLKVGPAGNFVFFYVR